MPIQFCALSVASWRCFSVGNLSVSLSFLSQTLRSHADAHHDASNNAAMGLRCTWKTSLTSSREAEQRLCCSWHKFTIPPSSPILRVWAQTHVQRESSVSCRFCFLKRIGTVGSSNNAPPAFAGHNWPLYCIDATSAREATLWLAFGVSQIRKSTGTPPLQHSYMCVCFHELQKLHTTILHTTFQCSDTPAQIRRASGCLL